MSDREARGRERAWRASGDAQAELGHLVARTRRGSTLAWALLVTSLNIGPPALLSIALAVYLGMSVTRAGHGGKGP